MTVPTENLIRGGADAAMGWLYAKMIDLFKLLGRWLVGLFRSCAARDAEIMFLRQQLLVLKRSAPPRLRLRTADRVVFVWLYRLFPCLLGASVIFKPDTLVRWHRSGFSLYWRWKSRRRVGRPAVSAGIRDLVRTISRDNPLWGAPRSHGELLIRGIDIAQSTVARYMSRRRGPPSPGWRAFLLSHAAHIAAIDLFVLPTVGFKLLYGLVILRLSGDSSSGPMSPQIRPPSGSPDRSPTHSRGMRLRVISSVTATPPLALRSRAGYEAWVFEIGLSRPARRGRTVR